MKAIVPFAFVLACAALLPAQDDRRFQILTAEGAKPSARYDGTIAWDAAGQLLYLFGGDDGRTRNDLWRYRLAESRWEMVEATGAPPARLGHTLVLDTNRRRLIVFGGQASGFFSDVWAFDIATSRWSQLAADNAGPSRRYGHSAIYDARRDRLVISHGFTSSGRFDDTWAFDLSTNRWQNISAATSRPLRRCLHHGEYDARRDVMYLFGGCASGAGPCPLNDLWAFNLQTNTWTELRGGAQPDARQHYGIAFDSTRDVLLVHGGSGGRTFDDLWEFSPEARSWQRLALPAGAGLSARSRHQGTFVPERGSAVFFGGFTDGGGFTNELAAFGPPPAAPQSGISALMNAFSFAQGPVSPGELVTVLGTGLDSGLIQVNGREAPTLFRSAEQLNLQVPYEVNSSEITISVGSRAVNVPVVPARPGINRSYTLAEGRLTIWVTGVGQTEPPSATGQPVAEATPVTLPHLRVSLDGQDLEVLSVDRPAGTFGFVEIQLRAAHLAPGTHEVMLKIGEAVSPPLEIRI